MLPVPERRRGFSLVEMVVVIAITGILGAMLAMLIKGPVQGYLDSAQRAGMTDEADTVFHRLMRDVRLALPNSVRVINGTGGQTCNGTTDVCFLEYLEMVAGGRYNTDTTSCFSTVSMVSGVVGCLVSMGDLVAGAAGATSSVLVNGRGTISASAVVEACATSGVSCGYNYGAAISAVTNSGIDAADDIVYLTASSVFPATNLSGNHRFQIVNTPVSYVCDPTSGMLVRYWNYGIQPGQPNSIATAPLASASTSSAVLASHVSSCRFTVAYITDASGQSGVLVSVPLGIARQNAGDGQSDKLTLYGTIYVGSESSVYGGANGGVP